MGGYGSSSALPSPAVGGERSGPARDSDRRLDGLENQLRQLMDQVKELKAMQQRVPASSAHAGNGTAYLPGSQ